MADNSPAAAASPIVGVGASAGGLEALEILFRNMPSNTGLSFIVVTHLPRDRESILCEILGRFTTMPVSVVGDGQRVDSPASPPPLPLPARAAPGPDQAASSFSSTMGSWRTRTPVA